VFALVVCGTTALVFGLVPALFTRIDLVGALAQNSRSVAGAAKQRRARQALVIAEVMMAFILVFGAGLFANSFLRLRNVPLGFEPQNRLVVGVPLSGDRYASPENIVGFASRLIAQALTVPGVSQAAIGSSLPLGSGLAMRVDPKLQS
jgi:putative ABC transport system permease protein